VTAAASAFELVPGSRFFSFQTLRLLAVAPAGGSDPGEVLRCAAALSPDDLDGWVATWSALARELDERAAASAGTTARDAWFRAASAWRQAEFCADGPPALELFRSSRRAFARAAELSGWLEAVEVPLGPTSMAAWWCAPDGPPPWPAVVFPGGADSTAEEDWFAAGRALRERGLAVLLLDGPGQGATLRERGLPTRPDFEVPVAAAVDWLERRADVDAARIALLSWSFGGHLAARAAALERRLAACVVWGAYYAWRAEEELTGFTATGLDADAFDARGGERLLDAFGAWELRTWRRLFAASTTAEVLKRGASFRLDAELLAGLRCPLLVLHGGGDWMSRPDDARRLHAEAGAADRTLIVYPAGGHGELHCQVDALTRAQGDIVGWLAHRLGAGPSARGPRARG